MSVEYSSRVLAQDPENGYAEMSNTLFLVSAVIALAAFAFAAFTWKAGWEQNRRDLFLSVHDRLCQADTDIGARMLRNEVNSKEDAFSVRDDRPDDWRQFEERRSASPDAAQTSSRAA